MKLADFLNNSQEVTDIADIPKLQWDVIKTDIIEIKNVTDPYFKRLNNTKAKLIKSRVFKRKLDATGDFETHPDGSYVFYDATIPVGSACILSTINLDLPFRYNYPKGFSFIDASFNKNNPGFLYTIPKEYLYKKPAVALALSRKKMDSYYSIRAELINYGKVYLHVVPYKPNRVYRSSILLKTHYNSEYDFEGEMVQVIALWKEVGILVNVEEVDYNLYDVDIEEVCLGGKDFNEEE